jgi:hypothetical protein
VFSTKRTEFGFAERIDYETELPAVPIDSNDGRELVVATFLTKARYWHYEFEFRIVANTSGLTDASTPLTPDGDFIFPDANLIGIIYGCRMLDSSKQCIEAMLAKRKSPVGRVQAIRDDDLYALRFETLR